MRRAEAEVLVIPNARELRHRVRDVINVYLVDKWPQPSSREQRTTWRTEVVREAIRLMSYYLRGDPLPGRSEEFKKAQRAMGLKPSR